ncbi:MAG TPA: hypothetical protein VK530_15370 [Candidatus Acidoferrum sp.]|nr:hypothetical protein [Candidatus Acidoferrum sp.]
MLLRISLIIAILAGIGTIVVTQMQARKQIQTVIEVRDDNIKGRAQEKGRADKTEKTLAVTSNLLTQTKATLAKTEEELNNTKQQLAASQSNLQKTDADLRAEVNKRKDLEAQLAKWAQLGLTPEQVVELQNRLKSIGDAIVALEDEKKIIARDRDEWKNKYDALTGGEEYVAPIPAGTKGKIVAVDPKWNFVVLNIGKDKGLLERGVLLVHRASKFVGKVRIAEVMESRCIANVMPGTTLAEIQEGDQVLSLQ